ncbi:HD domain-containing protein [Alkalibacillus haloalkaliphilus]|uniref:Phosphohydrolase n=1 Tax=Alkalibacillus haloalkaliphilus TaxID=94136 RepID=A0A511W4P8_9BACI|nr:HD domain-containing protein [Alkalibacillus haloalkaliphilus]GEN46040.1 phosphohydrolase [Alkalibacillus haloalkaliphilus]
MNQKFVIQNTEEFVRTKLEQEGTGHDWWHIARVVELTKTIAEDEEANLFISIMAALLHDLIDDKLVEDKEAALHEVKSWLDSQQVVEHDQVHILDIIQTISFKEAHNHLTSLEAQVVQDADRLDAIGAVGIARCFAFAGAKGNLIHDPDEEPEINMSQEQYREKNGTAINHFYEKLLKLKELMNTSTGYQLAEERHQFMEQYLEQFYKEWKGIR